jgi:hypothetical protein
VVLLNVVCFGPEDKYIHGHVIDARKSLTKDSRFRLDEAHAQPAPGMLDCQAMITYVPAHAGWLKDDGTSVLWVGDAVAPLSAFGKIGGDAVVLDACCTATDGWLYDEEGRLRAECKALAGKPLLGGSGDAKPQDTHGKWILGELLEALSGMEDAGSDEDLLSLLTAVWDRAATKAGKAAHNSTLRKAYRTRMVTDTLDGAVLAR